MIEIDIIILSYAKNDYLKSLTQQTIDTLLTSENPIDIKFEILVIESEKSIYPYQFLSSTTIYPTEKFGFHKYLNIGIKSTSNSFLCLCNNDLVFHKGWASELLKIMKENPSISSVNPYCPNFIPTQNINSDREFVLGNRYNLFKGILTGWCIFVRREIFEKIGFLDEQFEFWYADRDYGMTLLKYNINHALILNSVVTHLGNQSHSTIENDLIDNFTVMQEKVFNKKWNIQNNKLLSIIKNLKEIILNTKFFK